MDTYGLFPESVRVRAKQNQAYLNAKALSQFVWGVNGRHSKRIQATAKNRRRYKYWIGVEQKWLAKEESVFRK